MSSINDDIFKISKNEWETFFSSNDVLVPYLDLCVFAVNHLRRNLGNGTIYEFGCGLGNNLKFIRQNFNNVRLLGSDISSVAIQKLKAEKIENSDFWINDQDLRLVGREKIDIIIERGSIQHVPKNLARDYINQIYNSMTVGGVGYFEIASVSHDKFNLLGESGFDNGYGFRTFYTLEEIRCLFSQFQIKRIYHLTRELISDAVDGRRFCQGSFQIEVFKS